MSNYREQIENTVVYGAMYNAATGKEYVAIDVLNKVSIDMFTTPKAYYIFRCMDQLSKAGETVDMIKVYTKIKGEKTEQAFSNISQAEFGKSIMEAGVFENEVLSAVSQLRSEHFKDEAAQNIMLLANNSQIDGYSVSMMADMSESITETLRKGTCEARDDSNSWDGYIRKLEAEMAYGKRILPTPWEGMNRILKGGFEDFELIVIGARPSVGKTALAINIANSVCAAGHDVGLFSLEVDNTQIRNRAVSAESGIHYGSFRSGVNEEQLRRVKASVEKIRGWGLHIFDEVNYSVAKIRAEAKRLMLKTELRLIVIDYLQLMTPANPKDIREQQIAQISRDLKKLTKELGIPVVLLAQLNRGNEKNNREPRVSDLRESGAIEQDADIIILLHEMAKADPNRKPVKAIIGKGRSSGKGVVNLLFNGEVQLFEEDYTNSWKQAEIDREERRQQGNGLN